MLPVEGGDHLAGEEVGEGHQLSLGKADGGLDPPDDRACFRREPHAAQDRRDLDFHLRAAGAHQKPADAFGFALQVDGGAVDLSADPPGQAPQGRVDRGERGRPIREGQVGQVDVDREPGQVAPEEIDRRPALEREFGLARQQRQPADEHGDLGAILGVAHGAAISRGTVIL